MAEYGCLCASQRSLCNRKGNLSTLDALWYSLKPNTEHKMD